MDVVRGKLFQVRVVVVVPYQIKKNYNKPNKCNIKSLDHKMNNFNITTNPM